MTNKLFALFFLIIAERSEAQSAKLSCVSKTFIKIFDAKLRLTLLALLSSAILNPKNRPTYWSIRPQGLNSPEHFFSGKMPSRILQVSSSLAAHQKPAGNKWKKRSNEQEDDPDVESYGIKFDNRC